MRTIEVTEGPIRRCIGLCDERDHRFKERYLMSVRQRPPNLDSSRPVSANCSRLPDDLANGSVAGPAISGGTAEERARYLRPMLMVSSGVKPSGRKPALLGTPVADTYEALFRSRP